MLVFFVMLGSTDSMPGRELPAAAAPTVAGPELIDVWWAIGVGLGAATFAAAGARVSGGPRWAVASYGALGGAACGFALGWVAAAIFGRPLGLDGYGDLATLATYGLAGLLVGGLAGGGAAGWSESRGMRSTIYVGEAAAMVLSVAYLSWVW